MGLPSRHALVNGKAKYARIFIQNKYPLPDEDTPPIEVWHRCIRHAMMLIRREGSVADVYQVLYRAMQAFEGIEYSYDGGKSYELIDPSPFHDFDKDNEEYLARHEELMNARLRLSPCPIASERKTPSTI